MTKEESRIPKEDLEFAVDELNRELLDNAEGDDSISKENGAIMVEEIKAASEEIDVDDVFTQRTADVLRALGVETKFNIKKEKKVSAKVKAKVKTKTIGKTKNKRVPVSKQKKTGVKKGVGVIAAILKIITDKPTSKEGILKQLVKKFPDRVEDAMKKTINAQLPKRMAKEKGIKITEKDGKYSTKGK